MEKFLITVLCSPDRQLPDSYNPTQTDLPVPDAKLDMTHLIGYTLTNAVTAAINELDHTRVEPTDVTVNFAALNGSAFNAPDYWIVLDDIGGQRYLRKTAAYRRERIVQVLKQAVAEALMGVPTDIYPVIYVGDRSK